MPLDPDLVGKLFDSMETSDKKASAPSADKILTTRQKTPSSFVDGKWLKAEVMQKAPWLHLESRVSEQSFWHNYEAHGRWTNLTPDARLDHLKRVGSTLSARASEVVEIEAVLHGAPSDLLTKEVLPFLTSCWNFNGAWAALEDPQDRQFYSSGSVVVDLRLSRFPLLEGCLAAASALAAGCSVTILGHQRMESLLFLVSISNLPAGVLNVVVTADPPSEDLGRTVANFGPIRPINGQFGCSDNIHYFCGRSVMLVLSHSDFEAAARSLVEETTKRANYSIWPVSEALVQEHLFQPFVTYLEKILPKKALCPNKWPQTAIAPVRKYAKAEGLKLLESGEGVILVNGRFEEASTAAAIESSPFVVGVLPVRSLSEALGQVNTRPRTLSASVWSHDLPLTQQAVNSLKLSLVWTNQHGVLPTPGVGLGSSLYSGGGRWGGLNGVLNWKQWRPTVCDKGAHIQQTKWAEEGTAHSLDFLVDGCLVAPAATKVLLGKSDQPAVKVGFLNSKEVAAAVSASLKAFPSWSSLSQEARAEALLKLSKAVAASEAAYGQLLFQSDYGEQGPKVAASEIKAATQALNTWAAKAATKQVLQNVVDGRCVSREVGIGVVAICGPIDSLGSLTSLLAAALAAGNCCVIGASGRRPLAALHLAKIGATLPPGVLGILGPGAEGPLAAHPEVAALWTGLRNTSSLAASVAKRSWRVDAACLDKCPDAFFRHQTTTCKTTFASE